MPRCAFLSISNTEGWFIDDDLVHEPLKKRGWQIDNIPWDTQVDWNQYNLVVIRSPWDYQDRLEEFKQVLAEIDRSRAILLNALELVLWNIDKKYLFELEKAGVPLIPTIGHNNLSVEDIQNAFIKLNSNKLIVKPIIGANADYTYRIEKENQSTFKEVSEIFQSKRCMIQPFMENIVLEGEFSVMYFNGEFSHAILKTVGAGDFRVQEEHGGGVIGLENPETKLLKAANQAIEALPETPFYARVDLVRDFSGAFLLMELELIEPCLYFRFGAKSADLFAESIDQFWKENQREDQL